jgi:hypothetical protein
MKVLETEPPRMQPQDTPLAQRTAQLRLFPREAHYQSSRCGVHSHLQIQPCCTGAGIFGAGTPLNTIRV